jgi:hypothetical protein
MRNVAIVWLFAGLGIIVGFAIGSAALVFIAVMFGFVGSIFAFSSHVVWGDEHKHQQNNYNPYAKATHIFQSTNSRYVPEEIKRQILARQGNVCAHPMCSHNMFLQLHHITPIENGGSNHPSNLIFLCANHHAEAHGRNRLNPYYNGGI